MKKSHILYAIFSLFIFFSCENEDPDGSLIVEANQNLINSIQGTWIINAVVHDKDSLPLNNSTITFDPCDVEATFTSNVSCRGSYVHAGDKIDFEYSPDTGDLGRILIFLLPGDKDPLKLSGRDWFFTERSAQKLHLKMKRGDEESTLVLGNDK